MAVLAREGWQCVHETFIDVATKMHEHVPDLLVLDLMDGGSEDDPDGSAGNNLIKKVMLQEFCPVIVYSANPSLLQSLQQSSPLIESVQKGTGAHTRIKDAAMRLIPAIEAVTMVRKEVHSTLEKAFFEFVPKCIGGSPPSGFTCEARTFAYLARRRMAALLDEMAADGQKLQVWEQYLYPALGESPLLGDLLRPEDGAENDPNVYRLVLTPSCDMVVNGKRESKVDKILVAKCMGVSGILAKEYRVPDSGKLAKKAKSRLNDALTEGVGESAIPLPGIPGIFPDMCANLKTLELLDYAIDGAGISATRGTRTIKFERIASVDSPFREQVAWNYQRVACRPGVPDRDCDKWADTVIGQLQTKIGAPES